MSKKNNKAMNFDVVHNTLLALQSDLTSQLQPVNDNSKPVSLDNPIGRITRMDAIQQQNMASASKHRIELRLRMTSVAIQRLKDGHYSICINCEEDIEHNRLQARPETPLCLSCQQEKENLEGL